MLTDQAGAFCRTPWRSRAGAGAFRAFEVEIGGHEVRVVGQSVPDALPAHRRAEGFRREAPEINVRASTMNERDVEDARDVDPEVAFAWRRRTNSRRSSISRALRDELEPDRARGQLLDPPRSGPPSSRRASR